MQTTEIMVKNSYPKAIQGLTWEAGLKFVSNTLEAISTSDLSTWLPMTAYMKKVMKDLAYAFIYQSIHRTAEK